MRFPLLFLIPVSLALYTCTRANAQTTYKANYRVGDHQVGQWSGEVSVIGGG